VKTKEENMQPNKRPTVDEIMKKYGSKIEGEIKTTELGVIKDSKSYLKFKEEREMELTNYERLCKTLGSIVKMNPSKKDEEKIRRDIEIAHMNIEPWQAITLSVVIFVVVFFLGIILSIVYALAKGGLDKFPALFFVLITVVSIFLFYFFSGYPARFASKWKLKASSQMVPAILYVVVYMRHTANLEKAIAFASEHLQYPLALDFKKVFYNVAIGKFSTIKESLDNYLEGWRDYSNEFIESFHLIESSLYEPDRARRVATLEKSIQVVLDGVYEKMLKFTHDVKAPLTNVYMLAIMLPILGIALIPLASAMVSGMIKWSDVFVLYTMIIPFLAFFMLDKILLLRPGGYGETSYLEKNPLYHQYKSKGPYVASFLICLPFIIIGLLPLIFQYTPLPHMLGLQTDYTFAQLGLGSPDSGFGATKLFDFKTDPKTGATVGPFGAGALILSLFFPLGLALFFSIANKDRTLNIIDERNKTKQLEEQFNNSLFQIGNRLGNGVPPELVFGKVAESSKGLVAGEFFRRVNYNIQQMGMSVEKAIFDSRRGVILYYPSDLIATSMRVLIESSKKGLKIAAVSLMSISEYVKNIQKITERLKDILAEIVSEMKSNMTFLAPLLAGIVIGLALMIAAILNTLGNATSGISLGGDTGGINVQTITSLFQIETMIPPYFLQIAIGIYLIEVIFILTGTLVTIDSGEDKLERTSRIGDNLRAGMVFYFITALISSVALFALSSIVLQGVLS
jgi:Flp pilus assembly protein TadB